MRDSLLQLMSGQTPQRLVWTADLTYWIAGQPPESVRLKRWDTEAGHLELCRSLGCMPYYWYDPFWAGRLENPDLIQTTSHSGSLQVRTWQTPRGCLVEESQFLPESHSQAITRYPVRDAADLRILLDLLENSQAVPEGLESYPQRLQAWAIYGGLPSLGMPRSPLPAFFTEWAGVERGVYLLLDEPDLVGAILDRLEQLEAPVLEAVCRLAPPLIHFPDNLTSEVYTPFFEDHMAERYLRRLQRLHAHGVRCAVHLDGTLKGLLPKLTSTGIDVIEAITPQPVGDLSLEDIRLLVENASRPGSRVVLWGGLPGAMFAPPFTWQDIQRQVQRVLDAWQGAPFVLGTADQVPPDGDISMVRRVSEMIGAL